MTTTTTATVEEILQDQDTANIQSSQPGEQEARPNKYFYEEFAGYSGERYLDTLVQEILPQALWRTWWYAVSYQAPGNACYVGTARLASRVKPGVRKIELDFQELEARGLMRQYADRLLMVQEDGSTRYQAVTVKDFRPLYDLAHEYHLWQRSPEYIPAERGYRELIVANLTLLAKLLRFDCYRRLISNAKPGRKAQAKPVHAYYQCSQQITEAHWQAEPSGIRSTATSITKNAENQGSTDPRTSGSNTNLYLNISDNISSAYRRSENSQIERDDKSKIRDGSAEPKGMGLPNPAPTCSHIELEAIRKVKGTEYSKTESIEQIELSNKSNEKEMSGAARAKNVNEDETRKKPRTFEEMAALVGISPEALADMLAWLRENPRPETTPLKLQGIIPQWSRELGNAEPHLIAANITQASKLYRYARLNGLGQQATEECFEHARVAVSNHPKVNSKMAFFFTSLKLDILVALNQYKDLPATRSAIPDGYDDDQAQEKDAPAEEASKISYFAAGDSLRSGAAPDTDVSEAEVPAVEPILLPPDHPRPDWKTWEAAAHWGERLRDELDPARQISRYEVRPTEDGRFGFVLLLNANADPIWEELLAGGYVTNAMVEQSLDAIRSVRGQAPRNTRFSQRYGKR